MNDWVRSYQPSKEDTFQKVPDGRYVRRIYGGIELTDWEKQLIDNFKSWLAGRGETLPPGYLDKQNWILRFLNTDKAHDEVLDTVKETEKWLSESLTPRIRDLSPQIDRLQSGGLYAYGRDKQQRPIIVLRFRELIDAGIDKDNFLDINDMLTGYVVFNAMVPGQIEQYFFIVDVRNVSLWEIPVRSLISFVKHNSKFYKHRVHKFYGLNLSWTIRKGVNFVWNFLDPFQKQQLGFYSDDYKEDLHYWIDKSNLEQRFGGNLPDLTKGQFWPPNLNL